MIKPRALGTHTHTHTHDTVQCYSLSQSRPLLRAGSPAVKVHIVLLLENEGLQPFSIVLVGTGMDTSPVQKEKWGGTQTTGLSVLPNVQNNLTGIQKLLVLHYQKCGFLLPGPVSVGREGGWRSCSSAKACSSPGHSLCCPPAPCQGQLPGQLT